MRIGAAIHIAALFVAPFAFVFFAIAPLAYAQEDDFSAVLEGRVTDAQFGYPLPDVEVRAVIVDDESSTVTDADGHFRLELPPGPLHLSVAHPDYVHLQTEISAADRDQPLEFALHLRFDDDPVITAARRRDPPATATARSLDRRQIDAAPHRNAEEILRQVPGLTLSQHGSEGKGHQFFLRGFDAIHGSDLEVTLDGLPLNEWSNVHGQGYLDLSLIIPEVVESVDVIKGPFTLAQGLFATAGSADFRLGLHDHDTTFTTAYTAGTTNRHRLFAAYSGDGRQFLAAEATFDDGFGENRGIRRATLNARTPIFTGDAHRLDLFAAASVADFELPGILRLDEIRANNIGFYGAHDSAGTGRTARALTALFYDAELGAHEFKARAFAGVRHLDLLENYTGFFDHPVEGDRRRQRQNTLTFGAFASGRSELTTSLELLTALGARADSFDRSTDHIGRSLQALSREGELSGIQSHYHLQSGLRWRPSSTLRLDAGSRLDAAHFALSDDDFGPYFALSPRLSALWQPLKPLAIFTAYGRGIRPAAATDPAPFTRADAIEAGTIFSPIRWIELRLAGFATFIARESVFDHATSTTIERSATRRIGVEADLHVHPTSWLTVATDITATQGRFVDTNSPIPTAPWLVAAGHLLTDHAIGQGRLQSALRLRAMAPRRLPHGATGAPFSMLDFSAAYALGAFELCLDIENLLNQRQNEGEYHFASHWRPSQTASTLPAIHLTPAPPLNARLTLIARF